MQVQNHLDRDAGITIEERGVQLEKVMARSYPAGCRDCGRLVCACPPILNSTIGRIAHEVPSGRGRLEGGGRFIAPDKARQLFQRTYALEQEQEIVTVNDVTDEQAEQ